MLFLSAGIPGLRKPLRNQHILSAKRTLNLEVFQSLCWFIREEFVILWLEEVSAAVLLCVAIKNFCPTFGLERLLQVLYQEITSDSHNNNQEIPFCIACFFVNGCNQRKNRVLNK
jgi:hypothetical protein